MVFIEMFVVQRENYFTNTRRLMNGALVSEVYVEIILFAIENLLKQSYEEFARFVDFCEEKTANPEISLSVNDFSEWLNIDDERITSEDIINVALSAVDRDMVLKSPYPEDRQPRQMFCK